MAESPPLKIAIFLEVDRLHLTVSLTDHFLPHWWT